jgi:peptide/nickel transport system substrate-binding protein
MSGPFDDKDTAHPAVGRMVEALEARKIDRRDFLRTVTLLGMSAPAAYALAGRITGEALVPAARAAATPKKGGNLRIIMRVVAVDNPPTFSWITDSNMVRQCNEYLTRTGADNITRPYLAESWKPSDDLKSWTLSLRKDVKWSNGDPFVAEHAIWNLQHWLDEKTGSSVLGLFKGFMLKEVDKGEKDDKGQPKKSLVLWDANAIEKVDDHTIRLNGQSPQLAIPENLFHYPALILHPKDNGKFGPGSPGTGAFDMASIEVGKRCELKARSSYWGKGPFLESVTFIDTGDDPAAALAALAAGQGDTMYNPPISILDQVKALKNQKVYTVNTGDTGVARMKQGVKPFDDPKVRKAMRLAIDPKAILKIAHRGLGAPGEHHHVAPIHPEYAKLPVWKRDVKEAKKLLAEAGHPNGIEVEIAYKKDPDWEAKAVEAMAQMWKDAGITVKLNLMPSAAYWDNWTKVPFGFTSWAHRPLGVMVLGLAYRTGVPWNESDYSNPKFDELLTKAEGIVDVDKRREVMVELEKIMQEDGPIVQPLWRALWAPMDKSFEGFEAHPTQYIFCEEIWKKA